MPLIIVGAPPGGGVIGIFGFMPARRTTDGMDARMATDKADRALFLSLETSLHRPEVRSSPDLVRRLLADEFIEFGRSGRVYNKAVTIEALAAEDVSHPAPMPRVSDFSVTRLSPDVVLVTYTGSREPSGSQKGRQTLRSSIYRHQDGRWQMIFHQGRPIPLD